MSRRKYADYYYTIKVAETSSRNNSTPAKWYRWYIRNKEGEILEQSETLYDDKKEAEIYCEEAIQEHYR